ncbi:MAG: hypothetical protein QGH65_18440, partial [SAR324 cluster bacterium]|nr:hypothetical protein [SAR324 cluster bacterium]
GSRPFLEDDTSLKIRVVISDQTEAYFKEADNLILVAVGAKNLGEITTLDSGFATGPLGFYKDFNFQVLAWDNGSQAMEVVGLDDFVDDNDTVANISAKIFSSTDPVYGASTFDPGDNLTFSNVDNESDLAFVLSSSSMNVSENGATGNFTVVLNNNPVDNKTIYLSDNDSTEISLDNSSIMFSGGTDSYNISLLMDGSTSMSLVTTGTWKTPQTVTISGKDDNITDGSNTVKVTLSGSGLTSDNVTVTVADNDSSGVMFHWVGGDNFTSEDNSSDKAIFTVRLTSAPFEGSDDNTSDNLTTAIVNLNVRGKDNRSVSFSSDSLTFGSNNWSTTQSVTVTAINDAYDEGIADNASGTSKNDNQTYTIFIDNITSTDSVYAAINAFASTSDMSTVIVEDNDLSGIGVELGTVSSDNTTIAIKFFLMSDPEDNVTLTLSAFENSKVQFSDNGSRTTDNGSSMVVNLTWSDNATIYLTNDSRNIDNESDDDDRFIDNLTIFSFYGTASCSSCGSYNNKQLAKTLIRNIQTGSVYTDFDNATQMPK